MNLEPSPVAWSLDIVSISIILVAVQAFYQEDSLE